MIGVGLLGVTLWDRYEQKREAARYEGESLYRPQQYSLTVDGKSYRLRDGVESYLLIGLDKYSTNKVEDDAVRNQQQADFLFLLIVDNKEQSYTALHINRDTMAEIERYGLAGMKLKSFTGQLALSHTYGNGRNDSSRYTCNAVSGALFGVPIAHYVSLPMDAIPVLNDLAGGVTVLIEDDFSAVDPSLVQGQRQTLMGQQALTFVRARGGMTDSSNLNRMSRQRVYLEALRGALDAKLSEDSEFALDFAMELSDYMISDITVDQIAELANTLKSYHYEGIETVKGEAVVGEEFMEFYPDESALQAQVIRLFLN